ncbi:succinylglutamate desuccinylase/aspartoacylase family protein [Candidatus Dojkabacteria bacterium]|nr:succinylglutamate desuccinylase/aspartoacylase family protein [Candidatus Dojkabacteria bacterium]
MQKRLLQKKFKYKNTSVKYFLSGENPKLLIISGIHGDEYKIIELLQFYLKNNFTILPSFLFIPTISPSALTAKTRINKNKNDLNRQFFEGTTDNEAVVIMKFLKDFNLKLCLDFHEDKYINSFYFYDSGSLSEGELKFFKNKLSSTGTRLYSGVDDTKDKYLGYQLKEGYASLKDEVIPERGCFWDWILENKISDRILNFEIPIKEDKKIKVSIIAEILNFAKDYLL